MLFIEGDFTTLNQVFPMIEFILKHFEKGKIIYANNVFLSPYINSG
jgi:hypothetical protein